MKTEYAISVVYRHYDKDMDVKIEKVMKRKCNSSGYDLIGGERDMWFSFSRIIAAKNALKRVKKIRGISAELLYGYDGMFVFSGKGTKNENP